MTDNAIMQQLIHFRRFFLAVSLFAMISCEDISGPYYYRVVEPADAFGGIKAEELEKAIRQNLAAKEGVESYCAELSIVRYSSGKETYSFSGSEEDGIVVSHGNVALEVMVRIKKKDTTLKVFFLKSEGSDKNAAVIEMVKKLARELNVGKKE